MKWLQTRNINSEGIRRRNRNFTVFVAICSLLGLTGLVSCVNDTLTPEPDNSGNHTIIDGDLAIVNLPGDIAVKVSQTGKMTRGENDPDNSSPTDRVSFDDGVEAEYKLASGDHHFIVLYDNAASQENKKPLAVMTLNLDGAEMKGLQTSSNGEITYDNVTFYIQEIVTQADLAPNYKTVASVKDMLAKCEGTAFVLLNFDKDQIYTEGLSAQINTTSNITALSSLSHSEFLSLPLKDYKITINGTDYFTMSTSVYADNTGTVKYASSIDSDKVYLKKDGQYVDINNASEMEPAISAHVERIAVKYTVGFTQGTFKNQGSGVSGNDGNDDNFNQDGYYSINAETGLPEYSLWINHYTGYTYTQQGYSVNSEPARAMIEILGYHVNNTEKSSYAVKNLSANTKYFIPQSSTSATASWTDWLNYRSYWSEDPNYTFEAYIDEENKSHAKGYPHQFRQALESDSVLYYHGVDFQALKGYNWKNDPHRVTVDRKVAERNEDGTFKRDANGNLIYKYVPTDFYNEIGEIDYTLLNSNCVLKYWSFNALKSAYDALKNKKENEDLAGQFLPSYRFYSLENTYHDPGMITGDNNSAGNFIWNWQKAAYSAATNLTVLARMRVINNTNSSQTVYRGQNNVFYYYLEGETGLLKSKLDIFNEVILSQGNAGINILHAYFASHGLLRTGEDNFDETNLDKVAWNTGSVLWIADCKDDGTEIENSCHEATWEDLTLIPAEISGGDGQCLIAPKNMGANYKFFLAPILMKDNVPIDYRGNPVTDGNYVRDLELSVEISFNHLVALIHKGIGPIDVFTDGYMYYSVPVPHRIKQLDMTHKTSPSWKTLANIGVVRNNWYEITVSNISDVGTPVHAPDQPIVPVMDVKRSYINANVTVYGWHTISQGGIPMQ